MKKFSAMLAVAALLASTGMASAQSRNYDDSGAPKSSGSSPRSGGGSVDYSTNIFFALAGAPSRYCNILRELFTRVGHLLLMWVGGLSALWFYC